MEEEVNSETFDENEIGLKGYAIATEEPPQTLIPIEKLIEKQKEGKICRHYAETVGLPNTSLTGKITGSFLKVYA